MSIKEQLLEDMKLAMKNKDTIRKSTIQMARSAILQVEKDNQITLDDDSIIDVLAKELKKRKDSLPEYEKSGRQDLIDNLNVEIDVLIAYLPEQLTEEELEVFVKEAIEEVGASSAKDMGKIMQVLMPRVKGRADGKIINQIARKFLG